MPSLSSSLPTLRHELRLMRGAPMLTGEPTWLVHDPLLHRYIQIDYSAYQILSIWQEHQSVDGLISTAYEKLGIAVDNDKLARLIEFVHQQKLTDEPPRDGWRHFAKEQASLRHSWLMWLVHNYLFFRVPLVRPQALLVAGLPMVAPLYTRMIAHFLGLIGLAGLYLISRQWDEFTSTFQHFFTWEGAVLVGAVLFLVKAAHELGHAFTAVRYGCNVPTMGLAFMMMAPLLYTDVTDAWRLQDRRQRFWIDSAGIIVELAIAAAAIFLWSFLPNGPARSLAFVLAAVSLTTSLLINLNPFMRFDGYYLLSDLIGVENLQPRAFELGCWKLRELLFGLRLPCPEDLPRRLINSLVLYAWLTWIYRLGLFIGIAVVVYLYFFKVLGIILFLFEIVFFIARPMWAEIRRWYGMRRKILRSGHAAATALLAFGCILLAIVPWSTRVEIPAILELEGSARIYPKRAARITAVHVAHGDPVTTGQLLISLASPDIDQEIKLTESKLRLARLRYARRGADDLDREASLILDREIAALENRLDGLALELDVLQIKSPSSGRVSELNPGLHRGRWIGPREPLALITGGARLVANGYVAESDMWRIASGARGRFVPEVAVRRAVDVTVSSIAAGSAAQIDIADLASVNGGRIASSMDEKRRIVSQGAQYLVQMRADDFDGAKELTVRGVAVIEGTPESLIARSWRQALKVLLRESGV